MFLSVDIYNLFIETKLSQPFIQRENWELAFSVNDKLRIPNIRINSGTITFI